MNDVAPQGIQRYDNAEYDIELDQVDDGAYVLHSDHVAALLAQDRQQMEELADMADASMGYGRIRYEEGRADERAELWRLLEPLVTETAMRNTGAAR